MRKAFTAAAFISVLLSLTITATQFANLAQANPYIRDWKMEGTVAPPDGTNPPEVSIFSPVNRTSYPSNNFPLNFNVTIERSNTISLSLSELYYIASWQKGRTNVDLASLWVKNNYTYPSTFSINMTDVPEGPHWLEVYAVATGFAYETRHEVEGIYYTTYYIGYKTTGSSAVRFTIDITAPKVSILSLECKPHNTSDVLLSFITDEQISQSTYSLDRQENVTIDGNTTLSGLSSGAHIVTVYAWDTAGNIGASETVTFSVTELEHFSATLVIASVMTVAVTGAGLLVYFRKRKR